jgi:asparagine synthase (glutamine-hydrolysing)
MCGLFFVLQRGGPIDQKRFNDALHTMEHRGPDHVGSNFLSQSFDTAGGPVDVHVALGLHRLAILDLDPRANQPFKAGNRALVYNGEIYNYRALKQSGVVEDACFKTTSDTELLFQMLSKGHADRISQLNGMWGFCFFDGDQGVVTLSRDRYGKKPLFYHLDERIFCVSSTISAILSYLSRRTAFNTPALLSYLKSGIMFPGNGHSTHLQSISQLPPATLARFDIREWSLRSDAYFSFRELPTPQPDTTEEIAALVADAAQVRLTSDRPVGLLLSGGIDSSVVLAALVKQGLQDSVRCFIGDTGRSEDAFYARKCTEQIGIEATIIDAAYDQKAFERFMRMCAHFEKPFPLLGNTMAMSEMYEAISAHNVPVVLDGTGGDEIFGGYWDRQFPAAFSDAIRARDWKWIAQFRSSARLWHAAGGRRIRQMLADTFLHLTGIRHKSNSLRRYCSQEVVKAANPDPVEDPALSFQETLYRDVERGRLGEWIWHNDRNAMMSSIENRSPLLDYRLAKFLTTGAKRKFVGQWNKHELRSAFDLLAKLPTQWRSEKQGFRWAARRFLKENRASILELIESSQALRAYVDLRRFCDDARSNEQLITSRLTPRLLGIAGVERALDLGSGR